MIDANMDDQLSRLLDDPDFEQIHARSARFNLFEALGAERGELRHSNFLGYLLSPSRPHGLGSVTLQYILRRILENIPAEARPLSNLELLVGDLDDAVVHREREGIDLLIQIDALNLIVLIENKIGAKAGKGQLQRYREVVEARYPSCRRLLVFLTPDGDAPDDVAYHSFSYTALAETFDAIVAEELGGVASQLIIRHYVDMLRRRIVDDTQLRTLAARLYERHAEAFDFIFECRPRPASLVEIISDQVRACEGLSVDSEGATLMRFSPDSWDERLSYRIDANGWSKTTRGLLFEVKSFRSKPGRLNISLIIGPGDPVYREMLYEAARARPQLFVGLVKPMGAKFSTIYSQDLLTSEVAATMGTEAQAANVKLAWSEFQGTTLPQLIETVLEIDAVTLTPPQGQ